MYMSTHFSMGTIALIIPVSLLVLLHQLRYIKTPIPKGETFPYSTGSMGMSTVKPYHFWVPFVKKDLTTPPHHLELVGSEVCQSSCCYKPSLQGTNF